MKKAAAAEGRELRAGLPALDFVDLRLVIHIAEARSLTRGAERSSLSAAAASMRVKAIETALGTPLFYRDAKRGTSVTPAGEAVVRHARLIFEQADRMAAELHQFAKGMKGHVRFCANSNALSDFLPQALGTFLARHPNVDIDLRELPSAGIVRALKEGAADVGVVSGHVSTDGLTTFPYCVDHMVLVAAAGHPLANRERVAFGEALHYDFVGRNASSALHAFLSDIVTAYGRKLKLRIQVGSFEEMCRLIESGVGIGVMPVSAVQRLAPGDRLRVIRIEDAWSVQPLKICVREKASLPDFARELVDFLVADAASRT